jgi:4-hydroxy-4-methyl-2-oxoglutarate aldolase
MKSTELAPVSAIADVLALWNDDGWLTPPLHPIVPATAPVVGRVLTITVSAGKTGPGFSAIYDVLSADLTGRVLLLAGADAVPGAVWGEILTRAALQQGASAVLVEGWVRDRPDIATLGLPIYASGERVAGPNGLAHINAVETAVTVNATTVDPDDLIVVDATGCVRLRAATAEAVLQAAQRYATAEDLVVKALNEGEPLARAYRHKKTITDELRR